MAQIRNISPDTLEVRFLNKDVAPGELIEVPDEDVLKPNEDGEYVHDDEYQAAHPDARNWDVPDVWQIEGTPPPVKPAATPTPAPAEAPSE